MISSERERVRQLLEQEEPEQEKPEDRFTSLQPTYEDSVPPDHEQDWEDYSKATAGHLLHRTSPHHP